MHVPDGFIDAPVSVATGAVAAAAVAVSLRGARRELGDAGGGSGGLSGSGGSGGSGGERTAPLAGLVAAFIFAVQMLNFPVAAGTSGHLLGGALAAILVGPYTGVLCVSVVLLMQGVLFADGGLTALGVNITDMAVVTTVVAYAVFRAILKLTPRRRRSVTVASFVAALLSVPAAAVAFTAIYALGGTTHVSLGKVFTAMVGVHVLIGIGEAVITALTVSAVVSVRPDLVYGARGLTRTLEIRTAAVAAPAAPGLAATAVSAAGRAADPGAPEVAAAPAASGLAAAPGVPLGAAARAGGAASGGAAAPASAPTARRSARRVWAIGVAAALLCAGVVSFYASASPDGLEKVAHDNGIDKKTEDHASKDSPLADYGVKDISDARLSGGLAGVIGVGATLAVGSGLFIVVRRRAKKAAAGPAAVPSAQHSETV
ncbi:ABC-type cobalt transport system, permease component [Streptomyces bingchenggensis BCW-1]|uniref:ABC-type cobalt transport system, permease component n=2 Tax=Streptomyces TaxID=1883 RepID=D7BVB4_STRBB|nr:MULTISPECIES: energy-coupling factor ABC transporter permease [Streptomyces]ADI07515.1 ABC-type cobalt transport system, permease component [Streptomyces bingchenggensis BCW-1]